MFSTIPSICERKKKKMFKESRRDNDLAHQVQGPDLEQHNFSRISLGERRTEQETDTHRHFDLLKHCNPLPRIQQRNVLRGRHNHRT
jgi:hypothetical protein